MLAICDFQTPKVGYCRHIDNVSQQQLLSIDDGRICRFNVGSNMASFCTNMCNFRTSLMWGISLCEIKGINLPFSMFDPQHCYPLQQVLGPISTQPIKIFITLLLSSQDALISYLL